MKIQLTVTLVNLSHSSFTVRRYTIVKEVRLHSERGEAAVTRVVGIVATMPCYDMGDCACHVVGTGAVRRKPCFVMGDRAKRHWRPSPRGSGETELASEAQRGRARRCRRPSSRGVGRDGTCA